MSHISEDSSSDSTQSDTRSHILSFLMQPEKSEHGEEIFPVGHLDAVSRGRVGGVERFGGGGKFGSSKSISERSGRESRKEGGGGGRG